MLSFRFIVLLLVVSTTLFSQDTLTVAAYNVEALFNLEANQTDFREYSLESWNITSYRKKVRNIASVIAATNADILALSEVEDESTLTYLLKQTKNAGLDYPFYAIAPQAPKQGITVAIASKYPIVNNLFLPVQLPDNRSTRSILQADIEINGDTVTIFSNHWPSKRKPESYRISAAEVLKNHLATLPSTRCVIIAGDLNSNYDEATQFLNTKCGKSPCDDTRGETGINHILPTWSSSPGALPEQTDSDSLQLFYNPWNEIPSYNAFSYIYKGEALTIDHILFSHHFFEANTPFLYVQNSFKSVTLDGKLLRNGMPYRWQIKQGTPSQHLNRGYSDHLPVVAKFIHGSNESLSYDEPATEKSFGVARDGWRSAQVNVACHRTSQEAQEGKTALKIEGKVSKNSTVARFTYISKKTQDALSFYYKGEGVICFRLRTQRNRQWQYVSIDKKTSKSARYQAVSAVEWQRINLPAIGLQTDTVEVELRSKGGKKLHLLIDNVSHNSGIR